MIVHIVYEHLVGSSTGLTDETVELGKDIL